MENEKKNRTEGKKEKDQWLFFFKDEARVVFMNQSLMSQCLQEDLSGDP